MALDKQVSREADGQLALACLSLTFAHTFGSQVNQLDSQRAQSIETAGSLHVMKSKPLRDVVVESIYKSGVTQPAAEQQTENMFPDVSSF